MARFSFSRKWSKPSRNPQPRRAFGKRLFLELLEDRLAPSAFSDPIPTVTSPQLGTLILHKELNGFAGYGIADNAADIISPKDSGLWTFDLSSVAGLDPKAVVSAQFMISGVLDDHYSEPSADYVGTITTNGVSQFSGAFPFVHGLPFAGATFTNWTIQTVPAAVQGQAAYTIGIANTATLLAPADWVGIDYIELKLVLNQSPAPAAPQVTVQPVSQALVAGQTATFTAGANGVPTDTVQWQINSSSGFVNLTNGGVYSGVTSNTLTVTGVTTSLTGSQYRAVFTNGIQTPPRCQPP